ncbi:hypothetical protein JZ751_029381 [Albula glossodonta]|uniref:DUF4592 domain-containing protein n=1 Tax=Albula glossodonta TaxID=121402 RepID=A0A8T2P6B7_9TELE|nr:hypothetical protein JZ751_029381 [Albula glossodonta]
MGRGALGSLQLKQAIRLGSPPSLICVKKGDDAGALSEDDGLPCSPPEISTLHTVLTGSSHRSSNLVERTSSLSLEGTESEDDQMSSEASFRPVRPLVALPLDFSEPPSTAGCLDNSAARHRIAVKQKACAKRKPASREMFESNKVKILSGRVPLRVKEERQSAVITEPSAEEKKNKDVPMIETDSSVEGVEEQKDEAEVPASTSVQPQPMEEEVVASDGLAKSEDEDSSSSEAELEEEEAADTVPVLEESQVSLELPAGPCTDAVFDAEDGTPAEESGSLLQEVLSSLEGPLSSGLVLEPKDVELQVSKGDDGAEGQRDDPTHEPAASSSTPAQREEDDDLQPRAEVQSDLAVREEEEEFSIEEEYVESEVGEEEDADEGGPAEALLEKEVELCAECGEDKEEEEESEEGAVEKEEEEEEEVVEEARKKEEVVEEEKEKEDVMEEAEMEEMMEEDREELVEREEEEEEEEAMEEEKEEVMEEEIEEELIEQQEEYKVIKHQEEEVMEQQQEEEEEEEDEVMKAEVVVMEGEEEMIEEEMDYVEEEIEMVPEGPQQKVPAEPGEGKEEDDEEVEEEDEDLTVQLCPEVYEEKAKEESQVAESGPDSGELISGEANVTNQLSYDSSDSERLSMESSECAMFPQEGGDDVCPPQPAIESPTRASSEPVAFSCSSEKLSAEPPEKPSPDMGISKEQSTEQTKEEHCSAPNVQGDPGKQADTTEPSRVRFTIAPAWQRSLSGGTSKESPFTAPIKPEAFEQAAPETRAPPGKAEPASSPDRAQGAAVLSPSREPPAQDAGSLENPFGIKLRKTPTLFRYSADGSGDPPASGPQAEPTEPPRRPQSGPPGNKPALPKKPDLLEDSPTKLRKTPEPTVAKAPGGALTSPSWISVAKQKQKSYQENTLEDTSDRKSPLEKVSKSPTNEKEGKRAVAHSPPMAVTQDEPPWLALAKKKAKAWSEMPQIVQDGQTSFEPCMDIREEKVCRWRPYACNS